MKNTYLLKIAGMITLLLALFQAVITTVPSWALYFCAGKDIVSKLWLLYVAGYLVAIIFVLFGLYAFSGAGIIGRLPFLRTTLLLIAGLFTFRGLLLIFQLLNNAGIIQGTNIFPIQALLSSTASFLIGILYISGTAKVWKYWKVNSKI